MLRQFSFYLFVGLTASSTLSAQQQQKQSGVRVEKTVQYGHSDGQVGLVHGPDLSVGPESFAISPTGELFIADLVNQRILVHSNTGDFLREIPLPGYIVNDVAIDAAGHLYLYDDSRRMIVQVDSHGKVLGELTIDPSAIETRGYVHVDNSCVYFANSANKDVLIAEIRNGTLAVPEGGNHGSDGIHSGTGKVYAIDVARGSSLKVRVEEAGIADRNVTLDLPEILSAAYIGEDQTGRFYIQTEKLIEGAVVLEVTVFDRGCRVLNTIRIPENDYAFWTTKLLSVRPDGAIIQFMPRRDRLQLGIIRDEF